MSNKGSPPVSDKSPPRQGVDEDEKLLRSAESWLLCMCRNGRASWDSDPERLARFLQEFGNEKLGLNIPIDVDDIRHRLLAMDAEMKRQDKLLPSSSSSSSDNDGRWPAPAATAGRRLFIRRKLNKTDMHRHQGKLSMPCSQVAEGVLMAEEAESLRAGVKIPVAVVVDGEGRRYEGTLRWSRIRVRGSSYELGKPWNDIKKDNGFREGMVVEIWGVRDEKGELSFHLTRVDA